MVEKTHSGERHGHTVLVSTLDNDVVTNGPAGLCDILNAALLSALNIVAEGEERIRAECYVIDGGEVSRLLLSGEGCGLLGEVFLPVSFCGNVLLVAVDITVDNVISVGSAEGCLEGKSENLLVLAEEPGVSLVSCKTGTVDSRLLTCANADSLTVECIAYGVRLGI